MPRVRKIYPKDSIVFVTTSTKDNLPFIPNILINAILASIIARAQFLYGQQIIGFCFMANHLHMMIKINIPDTASRFIGYIKFESAKAVNQLLGRESHNVWCSGFDSPKVVTYDTVIEKLNYIYLNPVKARLVNSIEEYPGLSSWEAFSQGQICKEVTWIKVSSITKLRTTKMSIVEQKMELNKLMSCNDKKYNFKISPNAWLECYPEIKHQKPHNVIKKMINQIKKAEEEYKKDKPKIFGVLRLQTQEINAEYKSKNKEEEPHLLALISLSACI
ncbi:MAG: transposase [Deltaproteobacteria bacterium]|nr:transposase [Deltaproteobacteria bacterium]